MKKHLLLFALLFLITGAMWAQDGATIDPNPELTVSVTSLRDFTYLYGEGPSAEQSFSVSGSDLTANVTVTAPTNFEVCLTENGSYTDSLNITASGTLVGTTVYVRLVRNLNVNSYSGDLTVASTDATSKTVALSGSVTTIDDVATPSFSPNGGTYTEAQTVRISCATQDATIRYTLDGNDPTEDSPTYTSPLTISQTTTVKAKAWKDGYQPSQTDSATYTINIPSPSLLVDPLSLSDFTYTFGGDPSDAQALSVTGSNLTSDVTVTSTDDFEISSTEQGSYGSTLSLSPTEGTLNATVYVRMAAGLSVGSHNGSLTIAYNGLDNIVVSLSGTVADMPVVQTPSFSPAGGTYTQAQTVTISCATQGATIRYTLDGNDPTEGSPTYTPPLTISQTTTVKAKAWKDGYQPSQTDSATYNINYTYTITVSANPTNGGTVGGGGTFNQDASCTVTASANTGYTFTNWTENGNVVSTNANYTFTVTANRNLVANFTAQPQQYTIAVSANPTNGGTVAGGGTFNQGASCTVTASANTGYTFTNWTENGNVVSTNANYTFTVTANRNLVAHFTQQNYTINVSANPAAGGTVAGGGAFHYGDNCTVYATANNGYVFTNWTENGNVVSTNAHYSFSVTGNRTLVAHFQTQSYTVSVSANPTNGGTVSGGGTFNYGQSCTVNATPATGYTFLRWTENGTQVSTNPNYTFNVTGNRTLVANFGDLPPNTYNINVSANPSAGGTVTGGGSYQQGQSCTVTATANPGYTFLRWTENGSQVNTNSSYTFTVTGNRTLVAQFSQQDYTIRVSANPNNGGSVTGGGTFHYSESCTLTATANPGYTFTSWTENDNVVATDTTYRFTVTGNRHLVANFSINHYIINTKVEPVGAGRVEGGGEYDYGQQIELTANAFDGYTFSHWQDGDTLNPRQIIVTGDTTYTAYFTTKIYTINVTADPEEGGTVDGGGTFHYGDYCTVTATENEHFVFIGWTENDEHVSGEMTYRFQVENDRNLVAKFASENDCIIYVDIMPEGAGTVTGAGVYTPGDPCTLKAMAKPGFIFKNWALGDAVVSEEATYSFTVEETARYTANFDRKAYSITVQAEPEDGGNVSGGGYYYYGTNVTIGAIAKPGYEFSKWLNDENIFVSSEDTITIRVTSDASYTAIFTQNQLFTINAIANPEEGGTVRVSGTTFSYGDVCTLTATANPGYTFNNWTLNNQPVSNEETYSFQVTGDASFTANFTQIPQYTITVTADPTEGGIVSGGGTYPDGEQVTVTATPNEHYTFVNWTENGEVVSGEMTYTFTVTHDRDLVAHFKEIPCIEDINEIVAKKHTDNTGTYTLVLIYPNPAEAYDYQWLYSTDENGAYLNLDEGTDQYYYKGGALDNGWYKVLLTKKDDTSCKGETNPIMVNNSPRTIHIYPNPTRQGNNIVIENSTEGTAQLIVSSIDGRVLHTQTLTDKQTTINLNLALGIYVVRIIDCEGYTSVNKLIIQ